MHPDEYQSMWEIEDEITCLTIDKEVRKSKWDDRFLSLAEHISHWSKDPSTQVGAVIVDKNNRIVSIGYNGLPRKIKDKFEILNNRELKYKTVVHSEINAILFAKRDLEGCVIYTWPFLPCLPCTSIIIQTDIKRIVCPKAPESRWKDDWFEDFPLVRDRFKEAGVELREVNV